MPDQPAAFRLTPTQPDDFEALLALRIEAMRESLTRIGRFDPERARARLQASFKPASTFHIELTEPNLQRVGFVATRIEDGLVHLDHLYLRPAVQARGLGSAVLRWVLDDASARGLPVRVGALRDSDANLFYQRHGFVLVESAEFDNYYLRPLPPT